MSVLEFISSVLSSLSWPLALIIIVIVLRRPLRHLLLRLESLKGPGIEATFQRQLEEAKEEAALAVEGSTEQENRERQTQFDRFDLMQLAELSPRAAIVEAWLRVESALTQLAVMNGLQPNSRANFLQLLALLGQRGLISPELVRPLKRLRNLRNVAVHEDDFTLSHESVIDYIETSDFIIRSLRDKPMTPDEAR